MASTQVPFINWLSALPVTGSSIQRAVAGVAKPVTPLLFGVSGRQFFLDDGDDGEPVLVNPSPKIHR